ncbi:MAG: enoyl-CoA hydratase/isomerase family protein [Burkholderiaceae bacterium]
MAEIIVREDGPIGRVIISNPAKFNAMSQAMWEALPGAIERLDANPAIRLVVLEGDGDKAFVSGADICSSRASAPSSRRSSDTARRSTRPTRRRSCAASR